MALLCGSDWYFSLPPQSPLWSKSSYCLPDWLPCFCCGHLPLYPQNSQKVGLLRPHYLPPQAAHHLDPCCAEWRAFYCFSFNKERFRECNKS